MKLFPEAQVLTAVASFHSLFRVPVLERAQIPSLARSRLRIDLLQEELNELKAAVEANDLVEVADALADLQYVLAGAVHEFGMGSTFAAAFDEVHRSNMSKACESLEEAEATVAYYANVRKVPARIEQTPTGWLVYREPDDKVLKSINYSEPQLARVLAGDKAVDEGGVSNEA
ncbi:phosphoribosyl-ATP pyrophosphohydrolase-domain-containing protein [Pavlovales sp. CCMP2436]|nr:phosphoribosyl-ATP pyrophosphohydrolase-domain-containing protein [Pavlovales sp. CCMP2436]